MIKKAEITTGVVETGILLMGGTAGVIMGTVGRA
jgi:hypothetical protein